MSQAPLRFTTFLAPSVYPVYEFISEYVGRELGISSTLHVGTTFAEFEEGKADIGFICGLPYVTLTQQKRPAVELLAAPVLRGARYGGEPIYYSDVIVRAGAEFGSFADLRRRSWSYNDCDSQSGYGITRYKLVQMGETAGFFGKVVEAGFHQESIRLVAEGRVDASAIDSQVLAIALRDEPELGGRLKIIDTLGPSSIQPVVAASQGPDSLKADIQSVLIAMAEDPYARERLAEGLFERFVSVPDSRYNDIREMLRATEAAGLDKLG